MDDRQSQQHIALPAAAPKAAGLQDIDPRWDEPAIHHLITTVVRDVDECPMLATLVQTAARILNAPICAVTLVDRSTVRVLAAHGLKVREFDRDHSFCDRCVHTKEPFVLEDASLDPRRAVTLPENAPDVGHYAGVPLIASDGNAIGTFCIFGPGARSITPDDVQTIRDFATTATQLLEQKRCLLEYEAQRDLWLGVLEASMDGIYTIEALRDAAGAIVDFHLTMLNSRAEQILGVEASAVVGRTLSETFPGVTSSGLLDHYKAVATTGEPFRNEIYYDSDTLRGWFEVSAVRVGDGVAVTFANIDQRKQDEAALALALERFNLASAATEDMIWDYDASTESVWWNDNFSINLGYPKSQVGPDLDWWASLLHPQDRQEAIRSFREALDSDRSNWSAEYRMRRADGTYATLLDRGFILRDENGKATRAVGAVIDLSARIQAGKDLEFQRTVLEAQSEASQDGILVTDAGHQWFRCNRKFGEEFASTCSTTDPYASLRSVYQDALNAEPINARVRLAIDQPDLSIREEVEFSDGRALELHSEPLRDSTGSFLGRVWFVRDLTRQRQSNQLLRAHNFVLEASGVVLFRWKPEAGWPVELVSRNIDQFGYTAQQLLSGEADFLDLVHPEDLSRIADEVERHVASGCESFEQEYRIVCRDGSIRWVYDQTVVERDAEANVVSLHGVILDITDRRTAEADLAASEAMLTELTAQIPGAVYQYRLRPDGSTQVPFVSEGIREICGFAPTEDLSDPETIASTIIREDRRRFRRSVTESAQTLQPWHCEFRIRHRSGDIRWISGNSVPRREPDGSIIWHGMLSDVTARKTAEETLRRTTVLLERTNALARVGGWEYDIDNDQLYMSSEVKRILGIDAADSPTFEQALAFYTPESLERLRPAVQRAIDHAEPYDLELQIVTAAGEQRWVRAQGEAMRRGSHAAKLRGAFHDIHDQFLARQELARRAEELEALRDAAEAASRAKSEFIANMSHEIRTPLTAILGFSEILRTDPPVTEDDRFRNETVDTIDAAGRHLLTVINDILDISKIEAGRMPVEQTPTDLPALLNDCVNIMHARADAKGIALHAEVAGRIPSQIKTDPTRLRQILLNTLGNAVKFTDQGTVTLRCTTDADDRLTIDIEDTGQGIDPESQGRLFNTFYQADTSARRRHGGTGLGLVISRRCAQIMGGDVTLVRSAPGQGSLFRLTLPARPVEGVPWTDSLNTDVPAPIEHRPAPVQLHGRILFAEDGPDNQRLIAHHLRRAGAEVEIADNGRIALEMFRAAHRSGEPFDLVLTDIQMPELDGLELTRCLRAESRNIPIVAVTAHAMTEDRDLCLKAGCDDCATKPVDRTALLSICAKWLSTARTRKAA